MLRSLSKVLNSNMFRPTTSMNGYLYRNYGSDARLGDKEITDRVIEIVSNYDKVLGKTVSPSTTFKELGLDSLDAADVLVAVEEDFGIEIPDEEADRISSLKETIDFIKKTPTAK
ncbi:acyl carrier protein [Tieghemostelium lacteum]|uniref:Acyl carrier protein n=1 Tax=Tieghemostelium lacteum TaxID=361077 RepID=A0A151Z9V3_TIELA|nr:acyl carrier protein [Tieghemostelium lacteum]|eukprot:KYQ90731.1 acyl carrier protein [Tieghemostelium lacteum]